MLLLQLTKQQSIYAKQFPVMYPKSQVEAMKIYDQVKKLYGLKEM